MRKFFTYYLLPITYYLLPITYYLLLTTTVYAGNESVGTTFGNFLKIGIGARSTGMGEAFTGLADDATAIYYNPAGLDQIRRRHFIIAHNEWLLDFRQEFLGISIPIGILGTIGFSASGLYFLPMQKTEINYNYTGSGIPYISQGEDFKMLNMSASIAYSKLFYSFLGIGVAPKFITQRIDDITTNVYALDTGLLISTKHINFGFSALNLSNDAEIEGITYSLPRLLNFGTSVKLLRKKLFLNTDVQIPNDNKVCLKFGSESTLLSMLSLRIGYRYPLSGLELGASSGLTAGVGLRSKSVSLDYAYTPYGELGKTHKIAMSFKIKPTKKPKKK